MLNPRIPLEPRVDCWFAMDLHKHWAVFVESIPQPVPCRGDIEHSPARMHHIDMYIHDARPDKHTHTHTHHAIHRC